MAHNNINITRPNDIVPHEVATIVHDYMVDDDFDSALWAVEHAVNNDVTIMHTKPGREAIEANGCACSLASHRLTNRLTSVTHI